MTRFAINWKWNRISENARSSVQIIKMHLCVYKILAKALKTIATIAGANKTN